MENGTGESSSKSMIPTNYVWVVAVVASVLMVIGEDLSSPLPWTSQRVGGLIMKLTAAVMGVISPGWRRLGATHTGAALKLLPLLFLVGYSSTGCAPLRAARTEHLGMGALDFAPPTRCEAINLQRSNWGAAGKIAGVVSTACVAGGGLYVAAASSEGLSKGEALGLASCAVVAGGVVLLSSSKAEDLAQEWARTCAAPTATLQPQ